MRRIHLLTFFIVLSATAFTQRVHLGVFGGAAAYQGDLTEKIFPKKVTNGALGVTLNYEVTDFLMLRGGLTYSVVGGADRYSDKTDMRLRNLSFETDIFEFTAVGEYHLLNLNESNYSPYVFAGLAMFKFNPYTYDDGGQKQFLRPLSTEGQGITGYADRIPYSLTQFAIPFGGGVKFVVNDDFRIGVEVGLRKLFTDYLDDVSKNYIDPIDLQAAKGFKAVELSYRSDEVGGSLIYPGKDIQRGSPKSKDYYYFAGIHLTYRLGIENDNGGNRSQLGCPTVY
jgi:Domain of unknown function (DUF6089)